MFPNKAALPIDYNTNQKTDMKGLDVPPCRYPRGTVMESKPRVKQETRKRKEKKRKLVEK